MSLASTHVSVGYFGKIPSRGDFVKGSGNPALVKLLDDWLARAMDLKDDKHLTPEGKRLIRLIRDWEDGDIGCPYNRWISLVTGRQLTTHRKSGGKTHQVQTILTLPDNILNR